MLHPLGCPNQFPLHSARLCLRAAPTLRPFHFVLHDSGRVGLPTFPCVTNYRANGLGHATYRLCNGGLGVAALKLKRLVTRFLLSPGTLTHSEVPPLFIVLDCLTCTGCIPCRWVSTQLHDNLPSRKHLTKSFAPALFCLFRLLVLSPTADRLGTDAP